MTAQAVVSGSHLLWGHYVSVCLFFHALLRFPTPHPSGCQEFRKIYKIILELFLRWRRSDDLISKYSQNLNDTTLSSNGKMFADCLVELKWRCFGRLKQILCRIHTPVLIPSAIEAGIRFNNSSVNAGEMVEADSTIRLLYTIALIVSHAVFTRETKKI